MKLASTFVLSFLIALAVNGQNTISLFRPENKGDWYTFLEGSGKNKDSFNVFQFEDGMLHVSGQKFGYIATQKSYSNFHLTVEFKWGEKKFPPRLNEKRDAGILYYAVMHNGDKVWPRSFECQIQEGDCGDIWLIDSTSLTHADTLTPRRSYHRVVKAKDAEKPTGQWNKVEVIVNRGKITYLVNGVVVTEARNPSLSSGQILLQSEGAEIYYRNVSLQEL
jgi:hypothetical protein